MTVHRADRPGRQDAEREAFQGLAQRGVLSMAEVVDITIGTTDTLVAHGLGRRPKHWIVTDRNADARIWRSAASTSQFLTLRASSSVVVSLLVLP